MEIGLSRKELVNILKDESEDVLKSLIDQSYSVKLANVGESVYLRGLVEISNICRKNCLYCGIRSENRIQRYLLTEDEIIQQGEYALKQGYGSVVLQGGERCDSEFIDMIERVIIRLKGLSESVQDSVYNRPLGITLSLGEQSKETYQRWFEAGAHRYLLRIETSNPTLYSKIHPNNPLHSHTTRLKALNFLRECGYQVGSGVMIGLPYQTIEDLADDLIFLKDWGIDMCGMGPYIPHHKSPLYGLTIPEDNIRFTISLKMVALLRLLMPDINIAATTAMQTLHPYGRELAIKAGANVMMPNLTPSRAAKEYLLYEKKPTHIEDNKNDIFKNPDIKFGYHLWGDSPRFLSKNSK